MKHLPRSVESAPVIETDDGYEYAVLPISNGVPTVPPELLREIVVGIARVADLGVSASRTSGDPRNSQSSGSPETQRVSEGSSRATRSDGVDKIVTPEAMGIHVSTAITLESDVPLVVIRKREYGLAGEVAIEREGEETMYINDVEEGDRVLVLDDLVATGETLATITEELEAAGATVADVVAVARRTDTPDALADSAHEVRSIIDIEVRDGAVHVVGAYDDDR